MTASGMSYSEDRRQCGGDYQHQRETQNCPNEPLTATNGKYRLSALSSDFSDLVRL